MLKIVLCVILFGLAAFPEIAAAACVCRCVNGQMQPICGSSLEIPPICPPTICQMVPPSIAPIPTPMVPPVGATSCRPEQVLNPHSRQYEWRTICR
jgi:hypothetical protein